MSPPHLDSSVPPPKLVTPSAAPLPAAPPQGIGRGCLYTLSIPSCFGFLAFIGLLFFLAAVHDLTQ
ncbi:hypothetical protein [Streptomyces sp. NPDC006645]|uniref:hypothetical protein n=1 Tax=unclassified Streptomyces TaxID=2593676 RepID=UPI0033BF02DD